MAHLWLYDGYVLPRVDKPESLTFQVKFDLEGQGQLPPKTIGILTNVLCASGPNLVNLAWTGEELLCGQAQNGLNFDFEVIFDLEDQGKSPPQNNRDLSHLWSKFGDPSFNGWWVIARRSTWLPHTQTDGRTDTHRQTQATTIPEGQNWPRVKIHSFNKVPFSINLPLRDAVVISTVDF